jgi:hypothetical protein
VNVATEKDDRPFLRGADTCDPVAAWLRARPHFERGPWHSETCAFDGAPVTIRSRSEDVIAYLRGHISAFHPNTATTAARQPKCWVEIHFLNGEYIDDIVLPEDGQAFQVSAAELPKPDALMRSREFVHARWPGIESFWRPVDLLASLAFSQPAMVRLLVVGSTLRENKFVQETPLRLKVSERVEYRGQRAKPDGPVHQLVPMDEIADLVRIMTIRAYGHFCLHAATVAKGERGAMLIGPSGSGKTTTALALLRGGFEILTDEFSVLNANPEPVQLTGFKRALEVVGGAPATLAELEQTLGAGRAGKTRFRPPNEMNPANGRWVHPAAMFFLQLRPGQSRHQVKPVRREEAFVRVTNQVLDPTNVFRRDEQAQALIRLVEACPAYELTLGNHLASLPELVGNVVGGPQ